MLWWSTLGLALREIRRNLLRSGARRCSKEFDISPASCVPRYAVNSKSCASRA